ncbi:MAG: ClcB-like voltage-gated chloride channel protein [Planctomycetes bacterium]|nr:ClcB-like voltage-gated chloride channel protein [Planctomycetota bacterium]
MSSSPDGPEQDDGRSREPSRALRILFRLRVWLAVVLRPTELQVLLVWAGIIGVVGALSSHLFRAATDAIHAFATGNPGNYVESLAGVAWWRRILVPAVGGAIAGAVLHYGARLRRSETSSDYMEAIVVGDGRVAFRQSVVKCFSAFFSASSGASIGREGPLVQLAAMLAALPGRWLTFSLPKRRQLVACGAAAGIASAYNAPIGGAFFVAEIILGSLAMESFGPLVVSSVVATLVTRALENATALYGATSFVLHGHAEVLAYVILGLCCGLIAPLYLRFLRGWEALFQRLPIHRIAKLTIGGAVVGTLAVVHPEVCGNGQSVVYSILHDPWAWRALVIVLLFKVVATGATFGSGAVGGVFTPTLLTGASLGYLFGLLVSVVAPYTGLDPSAYALVGMGAFLAAATGAPVMAIVMLFELTLNYEILMPMMLACVFAYYVCRAFETKFLYGEALERKGAAVVAEQLAGLNVRDLLRPEPLTIERTSSFREIAEAFLQNRFNYIYVVGGDQRYLGVVALHDVKGQLDNPELARILIAEDLLRDDFPTVTLGHSLEEALRLFERSGSERLPVLESGDRPRLVGALAKTDLLLHLLGRRKPA